MTKANYKRNQEMILQENKEDAEAEYVNTPIVLAVLLAYVR